MRIAISWRGALVAGFAIVAVVVLFFPSPELTYLDLPDLLMGYSGSGRGSVIGLYISHENLVNNVEDKDVIDRSFGQTFSYRQLWRLRRCKKTILYQGPAVAALDYCGVVFITTVDRVVEHILTREVYEAHRDTILAEAKEAYVDRVLSPARNPSRVPAGVPCPPQKMNPRGLGDRRGSGSDG